MILGMLVFFGIWYFLIMKILINYRMVFLIISFLFFIYWLLVMIFIDGIGSVYVFVVNCDVIVRVVNGFYLLVMDEKGKFY